MLTQKWVYGALQMAIELFHMTPSESGGGNVELLCNEPPSNVLNGVINQ